MENQDQGYSKTDFKHCDLLAGSFYLSLQELPHLSPPLSALLPWSSLPTVMAADEVDLLELGRIVPPGFK